MTCHMDWSWRFCHFNVDLGWVARGRADSCGSRVWWLGWLLWNRYKNRMKVQGYNFLFRGKFIQLKRLMNKVPSSMSTAMSGTVVSQTYTYRTPEKILKSILQSIWKGCCVAVRKLSIFPRRMQWFDLGRIRNLLTRLRPIPVSRRYWTLGMICGKSP